MCTTLSEKALYHQIHPLKLATDISFDFKLSAETLLKGGNTLRT